MSPASGRQEGAPQVWRPCGISGRPTPAETCNGLTPNPPSSANRTPQPPDLRSQLSYPLSSSLSTRMAILPGYTTPLHGGYWDSSRLRAATSLPLQAALVGGFRCAMSMPHRDPTKDRHSEAEVLAVSRRLDMPSRLALARLRLLRSVLVHGPAALLRLLDYLAARSDGWAGPAGKLDQKKSKEESQEVKNNIFSTLPPHTPKKNLFLFKI